MAEPGAEAQVRPQDIQALIREAAHILKEPLETMAGPLRTYRKRVQVAHSVSQSCSLLLVSHDAEQLIVFLVSVHNEENQRSGSGCSGSHSRLPSRSVTEAQVCYT